MSVHNVVDQHCLINACMSTVTLAHALRVHHLTYADLLPGVLYTVFVTAVNGVSDQAGFSNSILEGSAITMTLLLEDGMHIFIIITLNYLMVA